MTITQTEDAAPEWRSWTRRTWLLVWTSVAILVLLVAGLIVNAKLQSSDDEYGPISSGSFAGTGTGPGIAYDRDGNARLVTVGDRTARVYGSLANNGSHSVRITGIDSNEVTVRAEWAPLPDQEEVAIPQRDAHWRSFPAIIDAGVEIQMRYTIRRPRHCQDERMRPGMGEFYTDTHVAHWESLLSDHTTTIGGALDLDDAVQVC